MPLLAGTGSSCQCKGAQPVKYSSQNVAWDLLHGWGCIRLLQASDSLGVLPSRLQTVHLQQSLQLLAPSLEARL